MLGPSFSTLRTTAKRFASTVSLLIRARSSKRRSTSRVGWTPPPGTLTDVERAALVSAKSEPVWHLDLPPTVLDLLGLWSLPETARFRAKMVGTSLLRKERTHAEVPLTNCSELWGCAFRNWGLMRGALKLEAREWDFDWHCWNVGISTRAKSTIWAEQPAGSSRRARKISSAVCPRPRPIGSAKSRARRALRAEKAPC